jgi:sugar (pentulose or hexulose) kinase
VGIDPTGRVIFRAGAPTPRRGDGLLHASEVLATVEHMLLRLSASGHLIMAACCAGVGEDGLVVGDRQEPLCDVLPWYHPARAETFRTISGSLVEETALPVSTDAVRTLVGWRWAREQAGIAGGRSWLALTDWPAAFWAGQAFMSDTLAARTGAWIDSGHGWLADRVALTLGRETLLPKVLAAGEVVGKLRSPVLSRADVLAPNAVVVAGGHDHALVAWTLKQISPRAVVDSMGTAEVVVTQNSRTGIRRSALFDVGPAIQGPGTIVMAVQELARNIEWASRDPEVAAEIGRLVSGQIRPSVDSLGEAFVPGRQGGPAPAYTADAPSDPRAKASAVLQSLARNGEERLRAVSQTLDAESEIFATGGWSRSPGWMAIKESCADRKFRRVPEPEVTAVAAGLLAARAVGWDLPAERALRGSPVV